MNDYCGNWAVPHTLEMDLGLGAGLPIAFEDVVAVDLPFLGLDAVLFAPEEIRFDAKSLSLRVKLQNRMEGVQYDFTNIY